MLNSFAKLNEKLNSASPNDILTLNEVRAYLRKWRHTYDFSKKRAKNNTKSVKIGQKMEEYLKI